MARLSIATAVLAGGGRRISSWRRSSSIRHVPGEQGAARESSRSQSCTRNHGGAGELQGDHADVGLSGQRVRQSRSTRRSRAAVGHDRGPLARTFGALSLRRMKGEGLSRVLDASIRPVTLRPLDLQALFFHDPVTPSQGSSHDATVEVENARLVLNHSTAARGVRNKRNENGLEVKFSCRTCQLDSTAIRLDGESGVNPTNRARCAKGEWF